MPPDITPISAGFALLLLVGLPVLSMLDVRRGTELEGAAVHRRALYLSVALSLLVVALLTLGIAAWQDLPASSLGWTVLDAGREIVWGVCVTAAGLALVWAITVGARAAGLEESPIARLLMPRDAAEQRGFLLLSGVAAICEEYVFRGFALGTVWAWTESPWLAAAVVSLSFGLAHGYQRAAGVLRAGTLGFLLAVPTIWTGSLFPAIVGHFWINAAVGLGGWRYLLDDPDDEPGAHPPEGPDAPEPDRGSGHPHRDDHDDEGTIG
ncbi:MAG: CPBP family intramembrane glutamic endopeptidase [Gemmatimonadota bacterium]|nr:CPBP family intramembrane glutamic endopeptidase [Gemmatimonadota bacterium]